MTPMLIARAATPRRRFVTRAAVSGRVVLDYELKREYQQFLQERNRGRADSTGRPDARPGRSPPGAKDHDLPYRNRVRFPDARIEFENRDRQEQHRDIEVVTPHYRDAHASSRSSRAISAPRPLGRRRLKRAALLFLPSIFAPADRTLALLPLLVRSAQ